MSVIKQIEVVYNDQLVGRLALTKEGLCADFERFDEPIYAVFKPE